MTTASIDFETRGILDLKRTGVYPYAADDLTDVWLMAWAIGDEMRPRVWFPGEPFPAELRAHIEAGGEMRAWNAPFERTIWDRIMVPRHGAPPVAFEQWVDTAAEGAALALPRALGKAAKVLGVDAQKNDKAHRLMMKMTRPRAYDPANGVLIWWDEDPHELAILADYAMDDVAAERAVAQRVRKLGKRERRIWLLDQRINLRGVRIDTDLAGAALQLADKEIERHNAIIAEATDNTVTKATQVAKLREWIKLQGVEVDSLAKAALRELLAPGVEMAEDVRKVLLARQEAAKSSIAKIKAMFNALDTDGRVRGMLFYHGASTGRWSGKLVQPQNFPRGLDVKHPERYIPQILAREPTPLNVLAAVLRAMLYAAPGKKLMAADFAAVEARVLAWVAGERRLLDLYHRGESPYPEMGAVIFGKPKDEIIKPSDEYTISKNTVLGAGFQMGAKRFQSQLWEQAGVRVTLDFAKTAIEAYRALNPHIKQYWRDVDDAAVEAVGMPGTTQRVGYDNGPITRFRVEAGYLWITLPSGRSLAYARPRLKLRTTPWGAERNAVVFDGVSTFTHQWGPQTMYGGLITENIVQATARDLLAEAMLRVDDQYPIIMTVHDEIVSEVEPEASLEDFSNQMKVVPAWAGGMPIDIESWEGERYRK